MKKNQKIKTNPIPPGVLSAFPRQGEDLTFRSAWLTKKQWVKEAFNINHQPQDKATCKVSTQARRVECRPEAIRHS